VKKELGSTHSTPSERGAARWDPFRRRLIVGFRVGGTTFGPPTGFGIRRFDLD